LLRNSFEQVAGVHFANALAYLQGKVGAETISSYGYCWGVYIGAKPSSLPTPVIKGHVSFHPSWMAEELINGDVQKMAEAISAPQLPATTLL
jgi:dienelactone hydrolase